MKVAFKVMPKEEADKLVRPYILGLGRKSRYEEIRNSIDREIKAGSFDSGQSIVIEMEKTEDIKAFKNELNACVTSLKVWLKKNNVPLRVSGSVYSGVVVVSK